MLAMLLRVFLCRNVPDVELLAANEKFYIGNDLGLRYIGG
jgi:hypothetical protein